MPVNQINVENRFATTREPDERHIAYSTLLRRLRAFVRYTHRAEFWTSDHAPGRLAMMRTSLDIAGSNGSIAILPNVRIRS